MEKCLFSATRFGVFFLELFLYTDFFPVSALHYPSCGLDRIRIVNILRNLADYKYFFLQITRKNTLLISGNLIAAI